MMNIDSLDIDLDRLVDGELSPAEYRRLLQTLDATPQGWRRCALAFLEAQALRGEAPSIVAETRSAMIVTARQARSSSTRSKWLTPIAMAASFMFALPVWSYLLKASPASLPPVAKTVDETTQPDNASPTTTEPQPIGNLELVTNDGQLDVPIYDLENGAQYLLDDQGALPDSVIRSLEQAGHRVERSPSVMPVDLGGGSRAYLPIDNYRITPVSNRSIQ